jgi:ubiquinone/menaquinone biosynthesis C-methylase UbiE
VLELWLRTIAAHLREKEVRSILDLGCGTGRFSEPLASHFNAEVVGIDPSQKMLGIAREKQRDPRVRYESGSAENISLPPGSVDMIFMSMSFHHFTDRVLAAIECRRVLREGGMVLVRTGIRERIPAYPYVPFFPSTPHMLHELLPDRAELCGPFEKAGFQLSASEVITQAIAPNWQAYADNLSAGGDSVLARLTREEFESGLAKLRSHHVETAHEAIVEPIDLFVFRAEICLGCGLSTTNHSLELI